MAQLHGYEKVELDRRLPRLPVALPELADGALYGGIVHQHLDATPTLHLLNHAAQTGIAAQISRQDVQDLPGRSLGLQSLAQTVEFPGVTRHHDQVGALAPEEPGDLQPQPARAAGDQCLSPVQTHG